MSAVCTCKYGHGSSRSVVRQIGVSIPLDTGKRIHIQVPRYSESPERDYDTTGLTLASYLRHTGHVGRQFSGEGEGEGGMGGMEWEVGSDDSGMETILDGDDEEEQEQAQTEQNQETLEKISSLESELARLKAQIANYALSEVSNIPAAPPAPPPPPMGPPPPPTSFSTPAPRPRVPLSSRGGLPREPNPTATPVNLNFSHVLQDLGSVKLRSVPSIVRSPGGTPMRKKDPDSRVPASNDPAAVIAHALRRKFAHNVFQDSPDKENLDRSSDRSASHSGFESPAGKLFN